MSSSTRLLIVHPEPAVVALMASMIQTLGHRIEEASSDRAAVRMLEHGPVDLILAAVETSDPDALEFLTYLRRKHPQTPVILLFPGPHPERAREAFQRGAAAVLRFPMPATQLRAAVAQCLGLPEEAPPPHGPAANGFGHAHPHPHLQLHPQPPEEAGLVEDDGRDAGPVEGPQAAHPAATPAEAAPAPNAGHPAPPDPGIVGTDPGFLQAVELARTIATNRAPSPVLILGERGTGKTLLARTLHDQSPRAFGPFVELACGALKEAALEVELFGRKGTGYVEPLADRPGKVAQAHGGTLFLDDLAALTPALQYKLFRFLQDGAYEPVGSAQTARADVRLVVAASRDLAPMVEQGQFRQDLFYRVGVVALKLPPLRHRGADVERLAEHFREQFARDQGKAVAGFTPEALELLRRHDWPGNVHELRNAVERGVVLCRGSRIEAGHLALIPREARPAARPNSPPSRPHVSAGIRPLKEALEEPEKLIILQALEALNWNRQETARVLDINRTTLYKKMKKYGLLYDEPAWAN